MDKEKIKKTCARKDKINFGELVAIFFECQLPKVIDDIRLYIVEYSCIIVIIRFCQGTNSLYFNNISGLTSIETGFEAYCSRNILVQN
jgi:hypothetical protein